MTSALTTNNAIGEASDLIARTLTRVRNLPGPNAARLEKIAELKADADRIASDAHAVFSRIGSELNAGVEAIAAQLVNLHAEAEQLRFSVGEHHRAHSALNLELQNARRASRNQSIAPDPVVPLQQRADDNVGELQALELQLNRVDAKIGELQRQQNVERAAVEPRLQELRKQPSPELDNFRIALHDVVNRVGELEQQEEGRANNSVSKALDENLAVDVNELTNATEYHARQAWFIAGAFMVVAVGGGASLYYLTTIDSTSLSLVALARLADALRFSATPAALPSPAVDPPWYIVAESFGQHAIGRIAAFVLFAIVARYLARLYMANSQQLVIYRDRLAALRIFETLAAIAPRDKKSDMLVSFAERNLGFGTNAFTPGERPQTREPIDGVAVLKKTVAAIQPLVESARGQAKR